jgi:IS605 OrfB family transposase
MQLVEQHLIRRSDPRFAVIDQAAFASKNLYNQATYQIRQAYLHEGKYLPYAEVFHRVKHLDCYQALPRKVSNSILILIHKNWVSFFKGLEEWKEHPEKFTSRPKISGYKHKEKGRNILIYDKQAIGNRKTSRQLDRITTKRNRRINVYLHTASRRIIDLLVEEGIGTLVIGLNKGWKQEVEMGRRNNQTFVQIPHSRLIQMPGYKAELVGITVIVREESYTSKASFLDLDEIPTHDAKRKAQPVFSGKRETRGLYRARSGRRVQADVNGSYNSLRKEYPNAFPKSLLREGQGIVGPAVAPRRMSKKRRKDMGPSSQSAA